MTGIRMFIYALWRFLGSKTFTFRDIQDFLGGIFAWGAKSFKSWMSWISRKVKVLELRNLHSAYINMHIPVILRPNSSVYDLQKLRYRCAGRALKGRGKISMFARVTVNDSTLVLFLMVKLARNRWEKSCRSYFILNLWPATGVILDFLFPWAVNCNHQV